MSNSSIGKTILQRIVYQITCALLVGNMTLMGCSCSKKEVKPISLGTSGNGSSGDGQGTGTGGSGDGNGGNGQGGEGSGSGEGNGASGTGGEEKGQQTGSVGKESAETQSGATETTESAGDAKTNSDGKGKGMSSDGEQNSQKSRKSASANRVETPPALPGRPPDAPKFTVDEAIQVADREMASARRSRTAGDLSGAFEFASRAYEAVSPYIDSNESCKKKAEQANKVLELINKEQPSSQDVTKPSVFE